MNAYLRLCSTCRKDPNLQEINIENNQFTERGVIAIAHALQNNTNLRSLKLFANAKTNNASKNVSVLID